MRYLRIVLCFVVVLLGACSVHDGVAGGDSSIEERRRDSLLDALFQTPSTEELEQALLRVRSLTPDADSVVVVE